MLSVLHKEAAMITTIIPAIFPLSFVQASAFFPLFEKPLPMHSTCSYLCMQDVSQLAR